jgi:ABC-type lipoprotein release transport system permease subunit
MEASRRPLLAVQVAQRGREFGVRMALGAKARDVVLLVVGRGFWAAAAGCVLGVVLARATGCVLETLLYQVSRSTSRPSSPSQP